MALGDTNTYRLGDDPMPHGYGRAGRSAREIARRRRSAAIALTVLGLAVGGVLCVAVGNSSALGISGGAVLMMLIVMRVLGDNVEGEIEHQLKREQDAVRGAEGEEEVEGILSSLGPDWYVLSDIECPCGNIDHLVISRLHGIFLVETKSHWGKVAGGSGELLLNGRPTPKDFVSQAMRSAVWVRQEIERITGVRTWVTALLVFTNAFVPKGVKVRNVRVINKRYIRWALEHSGPSSETARRAWLMRAQVEASLVLGGRAP